MKFFALYVILPFISFTCIAPPISLGQEFGPVSYTCPPCGCEGDKAREKQAGSCPLCGMAMVERSELQNVAVLIFNNIQLADMAGILSVFEAARTFNVYTVAIDTLPVSTYLSGVKITPRYTTRNCPPPDIVIIPGGAVGPQVRDAKIITWIRERSRNAKLVVSVCTGAFILAKTGLLDGLSATVLGDDIEQLKRAAPNVMVVSGQRVVDNGKFVVAAGPTSGIDAGLHLLKRIFGNASRSRSIAAYLDYEWRP